MFINLRSRPRRRPRRQTTCSMEHLESRQLLTASLCGCGSHVTPSDLHAASSADLTGSGSSDSSEVIARIVNGQQTSGFPSVGIVNGGCTGTLISPTHVLTAAHCVENDNGGFIGNTAGRFVVNGQTYRTVRVTPHPRYNPNNFSAGFDLAIMELDRPVTGVQPSQILRQAPAVGDMLTLVGFGESGTSRAGSNNDFGTKHVGQTPLERVTQNHLFWTLDNHNEANTAPGDSGGPAFVTINGQQYIAGVTSGGEGDSHAIGGESFDTRVDTLAAWIDSIVGSTNPNPNPNPGPDPDPNPPGDDHANQPGANATLITLNANGSGSATGTLEEAGDRDAFRFVVDETSEVTIALTGSDLDTFLRLFNSNRALIDSNDDAGGTLNSALTRTLEAGTYYITAASYQDSEAGDYTVDISATSVGNPGNPGTPDPPFNNARPIDLNANNRGRDFGRIANAGDEQIRSFQSSADGRMVLTALGRRGLDTVLTVYDSQGNEIAFNDDWQGTNSRVRVNVRAGETYYVVIGGYGDSTGRFQLNLRLQPGQFRANAARLAATDMVFSNNRDWYLLGVR